MIAGSQTGSAPHRWGVLIDFTFTDWLIGADFEPRILSQSSRSSDTEEAGDGRGRILQEETEVTETEKQWAAKRRKGRKKAQTKRGQENGDKKERRPRGGGFVELNASLSVFSFSSFRTFSLPFPFHSSLSPPLSLLPFTLLCHSFAPSLPGEATRRLMGWQSGRAGLSRDSTSAGCGPPEESIGLCRATAATASGGRAGSRSPPPPARAGPAGWP